MKTTTNVNAYIASFPKPVQRRLSQVRRAIRGSAPRATELMSYRMPAFRGHGVLVWFGGFKNHVGLYPPVRGDAAIAKAAAKYAGPKGNLKFPHANPLPLTLIGRVVRHRVRQDAARGVAARKKKKRAR